MKFIALACKVIQLNYCLLFSLFYFPKYVLVFSLSQLRVNGEVLGGLIFKSWIKLAKMCCQEENLSPFLSG